VFQTVIKISLSTSWHGLLFQKTWISYLYSNPLILSFYRAQPFWSFYLHMTWIY